MNELPNIHKNTDTEHVGDDVDDGGGGAVDDDDGDDDAVRACCSLSPRTSCTA